MELHSSEHFKTFGEKIRGICRPFVVDSTFVRQPDGDQEVAADLQAAFEDLFKSAGVDMTWHGHHHSYQRTCPLYKGECVAQNSGQ